MNVLLISQCDKRALTETRRIIDQFAERRGDRTWQTPITKNGLDTLYKLLRKSARKNTAVACHWIRGLNHSELLWTVGDKSRFNSEGAVPTNATKRNILKKVDENNWRTGEDIHLLTTLAALLHDLGKACRAFQMRLEGKIDGRNQYRHEWVSLRLFEAFVGSDDDKTWLTRLAAPTPEDDACWIARLKRDGLDNELTRPFESLVNAPLAKAIGWLVLTHHRLPTLPRNSDGSKGTFQLGLLNKILDRVDAEWNETKSPLNASTPYYWEFPHGLPVTTELWRKHSKRLANRLLQLCAKPDKGEWLSNPYIMHVSRLSLMLADHHYSGLSGNDSGRIKVPGNYPLYANTNGQSGEFNQTLDEHLIGVAQHSGEVTHALPRFELHLPRLARHKGLKKRSQDPRFRWQDRASDIASTIRERSIEQGAFIVNMASTGCGKTLANARIMYALADNDRGMRCSFAMGLRTLTLQTGRAFQDLLSLGDSDLAIRVGGSASKALFEHFEREAETTGSASRQDLLDENSHVTFEGNNEAHPLLYRIMHDPKVRSILEAPLLVCTIDHLTPATESERGGRQIAPMLRLMSSDLVLDEPDDFDVTDLPALTRLVHWAGLLGSRILLSSATLPPALVQGLFEAYLSGRHHFKLNRSELTYGSSHETAICCAWFDEFNQTQVDCTHATNFAASHLIFANTRHAQLAKALVRRRAELIALKLSNDRSQQFTEFAKFALDAALKLHRSHHSKDQQTNKRVSFGLVRMANIEPLVEVALAMYRMGAPNDVRVHLCTYHSQFPLLIRSNIERLLDKVLNRRWADSACPEPVFQIPDVRHLLDKYHEDDQLFIVLGSPVTEVGRDHDYDWAVVEPSSMRSLIQLAGRVRRHREGECIDPNIMVFETNMRHFRMPGQPAFCRPGFETQEFPLSTHYLSQLLSMQEQSVIDARPRIISRSADQLQPKTSLADLEHVRIQNTMLTQPYRPTTLTHPGRRKRGSVESITSKIFNATSWWNFPAADALLTGVLQQQQPFRFDPIKRVDLILRPIDEGSNFELVQIMDRFKPNRGKTLYASVDKLLHRVPDTAVLGIRIGPWGTSDYLTSLNELANELGISIESCANRFGTISIAENTNGWLFHPALGFTKYR